MLRSNRGKLISTILDWEDALPDRDLNKAEEASRWEIQGCSGLSSTVSPSLFFSLYWVLTGVKVPLADHSWVWEKFETSPNGMSVDFGKRDFGPKKEKQPSSVEMRKWLMTGLCVPLTENGLFLISLLIHFWRSPLQGSSFMLAGCSHLVWTCVSGNPITSGLNWGMMKMCLQFLQTTVHKSHIQGWPKPCVTTFFWLWDCIYYLGRGLKVFFLQWTAATWCQKHLGKKSK